MLRDDEGNIVRVLSAIKPADGNTTVYYQKIPAEYLNNFTNQTGETEENTFAQNASAILAMIDTTVYTTTLEEPLGGDDTLPAGSPYQGDLYETANQAYNSMFELLGDANNETLPTPEFVVNLTLKGQYIGEGYETTLEWLASGGIGVDNLESYYRAMAAAEGISDEEVEAGIAEQLQIIEQYSDELLEKAFKVSETVDSNGDEWWVIDINDQTFGVMSTLKISAPVTRNEDALATASPDVADFANLDNGEWIPAQVFLSDASVRGEEDLNWNCSDVLATDPGAGLTTSWNTTRNPDVPTFLVDGTTRDLTRGVLAVSDQDRNTNLREGIFGNAYCMVTRNTADPLTNALTDSVATDFDNPFPGRAQNGIGTQGTFNAGAEYFRDGVTGQVYNELMWTDDACDQAAAPVGTAKAAVVEPEETETNQSAVIDALENDTDESNTNETESAELDSTEPDSSEPDSSETESTEPDSSGSATADTKVIPVPIPIPSNAGLDSSGSSGTSTGTDAGEGNATTATQAPTGEQGADSSASTQTDSAQGNRLLANTGASVAGVLAAGAVMAALGAALIRRKKA